MLSSARSKATLKTFLATLLGLVLYAALDYVLAPSAFDFAHAAQRTVVVSILVTAIFYLLDQRRARRQQDSTDEPPAAEP